MNITHIERCTLSRQAAGTECGQTALVRQLCQRVVLVHELRQRARTEELLDHRRHGADVDQALRRNHVEILNGHALANDALEAGKADAELVLQQLAHAAKTAIAQMVNVVLCARALHHGAQIVDGCKNVVLCNVLRNKVFAALVDRFLPAVCRDRLEHFAQHGEADLFLDAVLLGVKVHELRHIDHAVGEDLDLSAVDVDDRFVDAAVGDFMCLVSGNDVARHGKNLARHGVGHGLCKRLPGKTAPDVHLLVELVASDLGNIVAPCVEEQSVEIALRAFDCGRFARTELAVDFKQRFLARAAGILFQRRIEQRVLAEDLLDLRVGGDAEGADQARDGNLAVFIDADIEDVVEVGLILQPRAAVRNDRCRVDVLVRLVHLVAVVHAGAADDLGDDDALCTVDDKGAAVGHEREVAHEDFLLLDLVGLLVVQPHTDLDGLCERCVALLALFYRVLRRLVHAVVQEAQLEITRVVGDGIDVAEHLAQSLVEEPVVGILLDFEHVGDCQDLVVLCKTLSHRLAQHDVLNLRHSITSQPFFWFCVFNDTPGRVVRFFRHTACAPAYPVL